MENSSALYLLLTKVLGSLRLFWKDMVSDFPCRLPFTNPRIDQVNSITQLGALRVDQADNNLELKAFRTDQAANNAELKALLVQIDSPLKRLSDDLDKMRDSLEGIL